MQRPPVTEITAGHASCVRIMEKLFALSSAVTLQRACTIACLFLLTFFIACGGGGSSGGEASSGGPVSITSIRVSGPTYSQASLCSDFTATVSGTGNYNHSVQWFVNDVAGGSAADGMISSSGTYCAPPQPTANNPVSITAVSVGDSSKTASSKTRIVAIAISPTQTQIYSGETQNFSATVAGAISNAVTWEVNGIAGGNAAVGTVSNSGLYTAPTQLLSVTVQVEATLAEAPTIYAAASVSLSAKIVISPANPQIPYGGTQQFSATINGVPASVSWGAAYGTISSTGLYTASATQSPDTIRAFTAVANGTTTAQILGIKPVVTSISPQPATALEQVTITGQNLNAVATVLFPDAIGGTIPAPGIGANGTSLTVTVPQGSVSGPLSVMTAQGGLAPVASNPSPFQRLARLRIRSPRKDLSAGESVTLKYALLGDSTPTTITFTADVGSFSGATYLAPGSVPADGFAHVSACISGTPSCDKLILGLHPFRISPEPPLVDIGQPLQLSALLGGGTAAANWTQMAGGGSITSDGLYTAGNQTRDGGPALVSAVSSGATERTSVGVTGAFPGLVNRVFDYVDQHDPNAEGSYIYGMALSGNRLFVSASNHVGANNDSYFWIDVYDITDPLHPTWTTAVETNSDGPLFLTCSYLYSYANNDLAVPGFPPTITVYSVQTGLPVLKARAEVPQWLNVGQNQGVLSVVANTGTTTRSSQDVTIYDLRSGTITSTSLALPLPSNANYFLPDATLLVGNKLFLATVENDGTTGTILTYDLSTPTPQLLGAIVGRSLAFYSSGNFLFGGAGGMNTYDISSQLPQFQSHVDGVGAQELVGTELVAFTGQQGCRVLDISNPQSPRITKIAFDGVIIGCDWSVLVGNYLYVSEYVAGVAIYDVSTTGGPVAESRLYGGGATGSDVYDLLLQSQYLYAATTTDLGAVLNIYDTSATSTTPIGEYFDPSQEGYAVQSSGNYLYFGMSGNTAVLNITQPASPSLMATLPVPAVSFARMNNVLYAGTTNNSLAVIDISAPALPVVSRTIALPDLPVKLRISGNRLFVADSTAGLMIYDISSPTLPSLVSSFMGFASVADVAISGSTAFVAADLDGLGLLDISNPANPTLISKTPLSRIDPFFNDNPLNQALSVSINNGTVYVSTLNDNGLVFGFDCTNPQTPRIVSVYAYGDFILTWVGSLLFSNSKLFVGGSLGFAYPIAEVDMSQPFDNINQYFPPPALQNPPVPLLPLRRSLPGIRLGAHPGGSFRFPQRAKDPK